MSARRPGGMPLAVVAGCGAVVGGAVTLTVVGAGLALDGGMTAGEVRTLAVGGTVVAALAGLASWWARRLGRTLRALQQDARQRLHDPAAPGDATDRLGVGSGAELGALARTLDALFLRVRVADEVAEQHRRTADNAAAGMFELLSGLVTAEEGARGQLAAELHDTVAQSLMAARALLGGGDPRPADLAHAAELVGEAEDQLRGVMARTRPPALRDGDLALAVGMLRDDMRQRYGLTLHVDWPTEPHPLPLATAITLYRFFQETVLNVVKHADVDEAWLRLALDPATVSATVHDDGPGFDPQEVRSDRGRHVGLGLLRERARLAGGSLEVTSWPRRGSTLTLRLPLASSPEPRRAGEGLAALPAARPPARVPAHETD